MKTRGSTSGRPGSGASSGPSSRGERPQGTADAAFARGLEELKRASTLQLLFRAARLLDEKALRRASSRPGHPVVRRSHASLFPHLDLEGTRITDLADRLGVTKQAVSQLVDDLERMGLVERIPDPDDARAKRVLFTQRGREGLLDGLAILRSLERELAARVGPSEMETMRKTLVAVLGAIDELPG